MSYCVNRKLLLLSFLILTLGLSNAEEDVCEEYVNPFPKMIGGGIGNTEGLEMVYNEATDSLAVLSSSIDPAVCNSTERCVFLRLYKGLHQDIQWTKNYVGFVPNKTSMTAMTFSDDG